MKKEAHEIEEAVDEGLELDDVSEVFEGLESSDLI